MLLKRLRFCCSAFTKKRPMSALSGAGMGRFTYQDRFAAQSLPKCIHLWIDSIRIILFRFIGRINFKGHRFTRCKIIHCRAVSCFHRTSTLIDRRQNHRHFTFSFICNNSSYFIGTIRAAQIGYHQFRRRGGLYFLLVHKYSIGDNAVQFIADPRDSFIFFFRTITPDIRTV